MDVRDDPTLLRAWRRGDEAAFAALVHRHGAALKGYALRMLGNPQQAEDVYAETFLRVARERGEWAETGTVRGWLFTIAHRLCLDALRRRRTAAAAAPGLVQLQTIRAWTPCPETHAALGERVVQLEEALALLPEEHRDVVLLRLVHGLSAKETADVLGCAPAQVDARLAYARKQLKLLLDDAPRAAAGGRLAR